VVGAAATAWEALSDDPMLATSAAAAANISGTAITYDIATLRSGPADHLDRPLAPERHVIHGRPAAHILAVLHLCWMIKVEFFNFRYFNVGDPNQ
jgi:hypothetical protein